MARPALFLVLVGSALVACDPPRPAAGGATPVATVTPTGGSFACPMHPAVTSDDPEARCGVCGMHLVARDGATGAPAAAPPPAAAATPAAGDIRGIGYVRSVEHGVALVLVDLHEAMAAGVVPGRPAHLEQLAAFPGTRFDGTVHGSTALASPDGRILRVELLVRDEGGRLVAGAYGPVVIAARP